MFIYTNKTGHFFVAKRVQFVTASPNYLWLISMRRFGTLSFWHMEHGHEMSREAFDTSRVRMSVDGAEAICQRTRIFGEESSRNSRTPFLLPSVRWCGSHPTASRELPRPKPLVAVQARARARGLTAHTRKSTSHKG